MSFRVRIVASLLASTVLIAAGCASPQGTSDSAPAGEGQALMETKCTMCHSLDRINGAIYDKAQWEATISRMEVSGLVVTEAEKAAIVEYLAERDAAR